MIWTLALLPLTLFVLGFPVYIVLLAAGAATLVLTTSTPPLVLHQILYGGVDNYALLAVPFFIFAGELMSRGGVSERLVLWVSSISGRFRGGLGLTTIGTATLMGAVSGSSPATVAATGKALYPSLLKAGYERRSALGLIVSSGSVAIVIPPSIAMILYGASAEQSIPKLFMAGLIPGLLISAMMALYTLVLVRRGLDKSTGELADGRAVGFLEATWKACGALSLPVLVLSGIYLGFFSPTEAGGIACFYAILLIRYVYRSMTWREILDAASQSAFLSGQILIIVASAAVFSWVLTVQGVPQALIAWVAEQRMTPVVFLLAINLILLVLGCFIDPTSAILVLTPILIPIVQNLGIDPIHFGVVMTVNLSIGMFTPPFGLHIFVAQSVLGAEIWDVCKGVLGFFFVQVAALLLITYLPGLSLWLVGFY